MDQSGFPSGGIPLPGGQFAGYFLENLGRIPGGLSLESESSKRIMELLNPPSLFPDVSRRAGETAAFRGIAGSPASFGTGLRMTDDERLRRIAMGEEFLTGAYGRQPAIGPEYTALTPYQKEQLALEKERIRLEQEREKREREMAERELARREREAGYGPAARGPQYFGPLGFTPAGGTMRRYPGVPSWAGGF